MSTQIKRERVGAIQSMKDGVVYFYGYGVYLGDEIPPSGMLHDLGISNPKIELDNGGIVWGCECWWGSEDKIKDRIEGLEIIEVKKRDHE